ncbi:MAG: ABC transporter ATP-binding protein [Alphaproteobacteria bacterium]|nr:ABC transporter ATP-binding protein [Alphaproteobacteria bacterium]MCB9699506.1 ABC transporter ATP-binding protein [Alphaproteobacteria bacterium]
MTGRRWAELLRPHAAALVGASVLLGVAAAAPAGFVWLLHEAVGRLSSEDPVAVAPLGLAFVGLSLLLGLVQIARTALTRSVSGRLASDLRRRLHDAFLRSEEGALGDRLHGLLEEVDHVQYGVSAVVTALRNPLSAALVLGSAAWWCPPLVPWAVVLALPVIPVAAFAQGRVRARAREHRERRAALASLLAEQLAGVEVIGAYGALPDEQRRLAEADEAERVARLRLEVGRLLPSVLVQAAAGLSLAGLVGVGGWLIREGAADGAGVLAFVGAVLLAARPLAGLSEAVSLWHRATAALERVDAAIGSPTATPRDVAPLAEAAEVAWSSVSVRFGQRTVLDAVDLVARPNELLAVVGPTGSGKTTLLRTAAGAIAPDEGSVTIGGRPALEAGGGAALVPQHPVLFSRTVAENVALGEARPDRARVLDALVRAGAPELDPDRTCVDAGRTLSGGERQRIGVARALYRGSALLLLDEPTASLDASTAERLVDTLRELRPGRTVVVATHDPRVWRRADRVVVVLDGLIAEAGDVEGRWTASSA